MKNVWNTLKTVIVWLIALIAVAMMVFTIISVTTFDHTDRQLFGYRAFIVRSDSMAATDFDAGDLILVKETDPSTLQEGDIISFISTDSANYGEIITHKIRTVTTTDSGVPCFVTYGTTTNTDDLTPVPYVNVLGKYEVCFPGVGTFFAFLKTTPGYICCILLPFLLLIGSQGINTVKVFRQYRKEQMEDMASERELLAAEREENRKLKEELERMKGEMTSKPQLQTE